MTLAQLQASLQAKGYGTDSAAAQIEMLNSVYRRLVGKKRWPFQEAQSTIVTVAGTTSYTVAAITDFLAPDAVRIEVGQETPDLKYRAPQEFRDQQHFDRAQGVPEAWTWMRGLLHVYPAPDRVYTLTVDYTKDPPDLAAAGDTPVFAATYHDVLVWGAIVEIAFRQRDWGAHQYAVVQYDNRVAEMERSYGIRQRQTSDKIKDSGFYSNWPRQSSG